MKTLVLSIISIAATVAAMTACTSESDEINNVVEAKVPIELNAGVMEITTKAVIEKGEAFDAKVLASSKSKDYSTNNLLWTTENAGNISVGTDDAVAFNPIQYYPADGDAIYMIGIAPRPTETINNGTINYTITGEEDIMFASEISGSKNDKADKALAFKHLLTQLKIKVVAENQEAIDAWGTITSIEVVDPATVLTLNLKDGTIAEAATPAKTNLPLKGFTTGMLIPNNDKSEAATVAGYSMVLPKTTGNYQLMVKTSKNTTGMPITPSLTKLDASTAYEITLTFKSTNVDVTASAGEWIKDTTGTGTVQ